MDNQIFKLYEKALPSILYAKRNDLLKKRTRYDEIPEEIRIVCITSKLEEAEDIMGVRCGLRICSVRRLNQETTCTFLSCGICALNALDEYFNGGVQYD